MENKDKSAYPLDGNSVGHPDTIGLTKHEVFCLHNGVPQTGDKDLDAIIIEGNRRKAAMAAMQGLANESFSRDGHELAHAEEVARRAIRCADELLKQLKSKPL